MVPNQHPLQRGPTEAGGEKTLDCPITAPFASPAGQGPHRHAACHGQHGFGDPMELAERGPIQTLA